MEKHTSNRVTQTETSTSLLIFQECAYNITYFLSQDTRIFFKKRKALKGMVKRQKYGKNKYTVKKV